MVRRAEKKVTVENIKNQEPITNTIQEPQTSHIILYKNGILVNSKFYDYSLEKNRELKEMLQRGEFDREVIGTDDEFAEVTIEERNEYYVDKSLDLHNIKDSIDSFENKRIKTQSTAVRSLREMSCIKLSETLNYSLPERIILDEDGNIKVRISLGRSFCNFKANETQSVNDMKEAIFEFTGLRVKIYLDGVSLEDSCSLSEINNCYLEAIPQ